MSEKKEKKRGLTRRGFLIAGGVLGGGFLLGAIGVGGYVGSYDPRARQRAGLKGEDSLIARWITLSPEGEVTLLSPHTEMGQGARTGLMQIVMDEMDVDPERIKVVAAPATTEFANSDVIKGFVMGGEEMEGWVKGFVENSFGRVAELGDFQITGGSASIRTTGWHGLRRAAAAAREMLAAAGAAHLGVAVAEVRTEASQVIHGESGRSVGYGELAAAAAAMPVPEEPRFKDPAAWKHIGKAVPRIDLPDKVFAKAVYGIDVEVPGMRYAAVAPPSAALATVTGVSNQADIEARRGVEAVVVLEDVAVVVADNPWRAEQAARAAKLTVDAPDPEQMDSAALLERQRAAVKDGGVSDVYVRGDAAAAIESGEGALVEAEYVVPFLAHAPMEPLNATVWEEGGTIHVATGVQAPLGAKAKIADLLGLPMEGVVLHPHTMGGGFGRRIANSKPYMNWLSHAVLTQRAVGGAVKLTWSREADVKLSTYRPSDVAQIRARLGPDNKPVAWHSRTYAKVGAAHEATPIYRIPHVTIETADQEPALPFAYWRSVDASTHAFFIESFIDELARAAGEDPVAYRLSLLDPNDRYSRVLKRVAEMSGWSGARPDGVGRGVALFESVGSIVAQVAEVTIEEGAPRVQQVWCVIDCGVAVNPDSVEAQMQGGIIFGLSAAMYGQITLESGKIVQSNFHDYQVIRFSDGPKRITVDILTSPKAPVGGAGEPGTPPIAPAVANAIASLKGERPRQLPMV